MSETISENIDYFANLKLPISYRTTLVGLEIIAVILLAIFCADVFLLKLGSTKNITFSTTPLLTASSNENLNNASAYEYLRSVDAFHKLSPVTDISQFNDVPESTLDIQIFGLRVKENGLGTAIVKSQGNSQRLASVGDEIASGIRLTAVYHDRIEFARNGLLETTYLEKDRAAPINDQSVKKLSVTVHDNPSIVSQKKIEDLIRSMDLSPYRQENAITGFAVGSNAQESLLSLVGIEVGDIINSVNGNELHSWERVKEIPSEARTGALDIQFERNGEPLTLTLSQSSFGL